MPTEQTSRYFQAASSAEKLARTLENLPIDKIGSSLQKSLDGVDKLVNASEVKATLRSLSAAVSDMQILVRNVDADFAKTLDVTREALKDAQKLVRDVDAQVGPLAEGVQKTLTSTRVTLEQAQEALRAADGLVSEGSPLAYELQGALKEITAAARSIRVLSDYLDRHPDALLFGKAKGAR